MSLALLGFDSRKYTRFKRVTLPICCVSIQGRTTPLFDFSTESSAGKLSGCIVRLNSISYFQVSMRTPTSLQHIHDPGPICRPCALANKYQPAKQRVLMGGSAQDKPRHQQ